jgi:hydroxylamine reductase
MKQGVCGKKAEVANLQDLFIWTLKGISVWGVKAREFAIYDEQTGFFIAKGLFTTITNADFNHNHFISYIRKALALRESMKERLFMAFKEANGGDFSEPVPECATWTAATEEEIIVKAETGCAGWMAMQDEDIRSLRAIIQYGLKGISAYAEHAYQVKQHKQEIFEFLMTALAALVDETVTADNLLQMVFKTGEIGFKTMALLDKANTEYYGHPEITEVKTGAGNNPGILISGHDLVDLEELLQQTAGTGIDIYTHGEMLPAHYYPKLKTYENLVGNYGNSWWLQKDEIEKFNGPVLFTSNCLVPPKDEHLDRIFTTGAVGFEGCQHIPDRENGKAKDFSAIINIAKSSNPPQELDSKTIIGGFGHNQVVNLKDKVVDAVKSGAIKRFVVMGGCDGRHRTRNYYTDVATSLPGDTIILTAGCAKYKYIKEDLGTINGIPRVLDAGQCNDSYSLIMIALELQKAFGLENVNDLPVSFDIAWYEQKAVLVLLALLHLGVKGIRLGPTIPGFLSPAIAKTLVEKFDIKPIATPEEDVQAMMEGNSRQAFL